MVNSSGTYDTTYVKHEGQLIAEQRNNSNKIFYHPDHLGSTTLITNQSGNVVDNVSYSPYGSILSGGNVSRYAYEGQEYDSVVSDYDFHFRKYRADLGKFTQPDTLIQNVYDPQMLNRYAFERGNPWKNKDEDGHYAQYVLAGVVGFLAGSIGYMLTHSGSGWGHVRNTYAAGAVGAATAVGTVAFATYVGAAVASKGTVAALSVAGKFLVGATGELLNQILEDEEIDIKDAVVAGALNVPSFGLALKPGSRVGTRSLFSGNNLKLAGQYLRGFFTFNAYSAVKGYFSIQANQQQLYQQYQEYNRQEIIKQRESGSYSGEAGYNRDAGAYVTEEGRVYPTNNPDWKPCGCFIN